MRYIYIFYIQPHWIYDIPDLHHSNPIWFTRELFPTKAIYFSAGRRCCSCMCGCGWANKMSKSFVEMTVWQRMGGGAQIKKKERVDKMRHLDGFISLLNSLLGFHKFSTTPNAASVAFILDKLEMKRWRQFIIGNDSTLTTNQRMH